MSEGKDAMRDVVGALHGSRLVDLPHVRPHVERCLDFIAGREPVLVDVGFDHGRRLHASARENPGWRVLGLEVRQVRVDEAWERAERDNLTNVLPWRMDARTVFARVLPPASVDVVEVLFPTPWWSPSLRRKRLLFEPGFVADLVRVLRPGGLLHTATDVVDYAETIERVLSERPEMSPLQVHEGEALRPPCTQRSRRQWSCERDGIPWASRYWCRGRG